MKQNDFNRYINVGFRTSFNIKYFNNLCCLLLIFEYCIFKTIFENPILGRFLNLHFIVFKVPLFQNKFLRWLNLLVRPVFNVCLLLFAFEGRSTYLNEMGLDEVHFVAK